MLAKHHDTDWEARISEAGWSLIQELGIDWDDAFGNQLTQMLKSNPADFLAVAQRSPLYSIKALSELATICQMVTFDANGGPEGDGYAKALRRHWYSWFKIDFALPLSQALGEDSDDDKWGTRWAGRLSETYAYFVDNERLTYLDLWVEDGSRMFQSNEFRLFSDCNIIVAVEKDSLFQDFEIAARALGARCLYSGKGKSSKAAVERLLRQEFDWENEEYAPFTEEDPLYVIHVSDYDYDGEAVIGPTFAEQCRRYTPYVEEARIGIKPQQLDSSLWVDKWYKIKVKNKAYRGWADTFALRLVQCKECQQTTIRNFVRDLIDESEQFICGKCGSHEYILGGDAYGFEVEAMPTRNYYPLLVEALLKILDFEYLVEKLRDECTADVDEVAERCLEAVIERNQSYQELEKQADKLERALSQFRERVTEEFWNLGYDHREDFRGEENDPYPEDFRRHLSRADSDTYAWRPFSRRLRTRLVTEKVMTEYAEIAERFEDEVIELED